MIQPIRSRATFRSFRRSRRRVDGPYWSIIRSDGPPLPPESGPGVAFAVSRRVGSAVQRNRIRRRIRAVLEARCRAGAWPPGWYLVVVRPAAVHADHAELVAAAVDAAQIFARSDRS